MKLLGKNSKKMLGKVVDAEKELAEEVLQTLFDKEARAHFNLDGITVKLGTMKLKLNGNVEVTIVPPKKRFGKL